MSKNDCCDFACKEEATSANAHATRKKGHFGEKISFEGDYLGFCTVANRTRGTNNGTLARQIVVPGALVLHVESPNDFVRAINHQGKSDGGADVHVLQSVNHLPGSILHQQGVDYDKREAKLGRPELQVADLQPISRRKREKRAHFITRKDRQHDQNLVSRAFRQDKRVANDYRAQEKVVEQVIHVIAPPDQSRTSILADFAVIVIGHVLQSDHRGYAPKPAQVARCQIGEEQDERRPQKRQHR